MYEQTLAQLLAITVQARLNCQRSGNAGWLVRHEALLAKLARGYLPSGSGFDAGTRIDLDKSTDARLVFYTAFHHMDECGGYDGWTEHTVTVTPAFEGINITISGRDRNGIKDMIHDTFNNTLTDIKFNSDYEMVA